LKFFLWKTVKELRYEFLIFERFLIKQYFV
jgi:hypothetical protein